MQLCAALCELSSDSMTKAMCGNRGAPSPVNQTGPFASCVQPILKKVVRRYTHSTTIKQEANPLTGALVNNWPITILFSHFDNGEQSSGGFLMKRHHPLPHGLPSRYTKTSRSIGISVQTVDRKPSNLPASRAGPTRSQESGTLQRTWQIANLFQQTSKLSLGDKSWDAMRQTR
jgi:hypothetical protein